jgi:hypothetical protein
MSRDSVADGSIIFKVEHAMFPGDLASEQPPTSPAETFSIALRTWKIRVPATVVRAALEGQTSAPTSAPTGAKVEGRRSYAEQSGEMVALAKRLLRTRLQTPS